MNNIKQSKNQKDFLTLYNQVHRFLSEELYEKKEHDDFQSFKECIDKIRFSNSYPSLKRYSNELELINRFRNLIIHNYGNKFYDIAEPTSYLMEVLKTVHSYFLKPIKIKDYLLERGSPKPEVLEIILRLIDVLKMISKYHFSQFPVFYNNKFKGMIIDNGLTNFTENEINIQNDDVIYSDHTIEDIINNDNGMSTLF